MMQKKNVLILIILKNIQNYHILLFDIILPRSPSLSLQIELSLQTDDTGWYYHNHSSCNFSANWKMSFEITRFHVTHIFIVFLVKYKYIYYSYASRNIRTKNSRQLILRANNWWNEFSKSYIRIYVYTRIQY